MPLQQNNNPAFKPKEKNIPILNLKTTLIKYAYHWPMFLIGLGLALTTVIVYLHFCKPVYEIKATLLIKDEKKTPDQRPALQEIDVLNSSKITENEVEVLKSKEIISQVVTDLQLNIAYQLKDGAFFNDLYESRPVTLTLNNPGIIDEKETITVVINDAKSFLFKPEDGKKEVHYFTKPLKTSFGLLKLSPTKNISQYIGETIKITLFNPEQVAIKYQTLIDAELPDKLATAVSLSLKDDIAKRGEDILNQLIFNYKQAGTREKQRETKSTLDFIDQRLSSLTGELTDAEKGIEEFKSTRGLTDISSQSQISLENMQTNDLHLNDVNVQLSVIESIENYINSSQSSGKVPATQGIVDPALTSSIDKLADLQLQHDRLSATTPETNPDFEVLNRQIVTTKTAIREIVKNIKNTLLSTRQKFQSFDAHLTSSIKNIPTQERQYVSIKRQQAIKESLYTYLLQKREEVSVSYASTLTDDRIVDEAYAGLPKKPQKPIAFALALLFGLGLPFGILYKRNQGKVTDVNEIKEVVDAPVIAELPFDASGKAIIEYEDASAIGEQFRALRIKLYYNYKQKEVGRVTLITSSLPDEGKSYISGNLSLALAAASKKTIVLELDMRKPQIAGLFKKADGHLGISEFLNGRVRIDQIIQKSGLNANLDLISCGNEVSNPTELLEQEKFEELIKLLQKDYADIIIDSPPVRLVSDAMIISRMADIALFVIRQGITEKAELDFIQDLVLQNQLPDLKIIFNGIQRIKYGYGYDYDKNNYYKDDKKNKSGRSILSNFSQRF